MTLISLDTNIIFSTLNLGDANHAVARALVGQMGATELMILSPPVFTELCASKTWLQIEGWLNLSGIEVIWEMPPAVWERAGQTFRAYADQRRNRVLPRRIAADFLIAAHAEHHGASLLTFDDTVYQAVFPDVKRIPLP
ncbi:PIN domain-containing protein [Deinococcus sp.]|uniref:PIN domain-containing protein n=1 Tax=Deinococcus sp. TaxID=47478 RepID=UPI0025F04CD0|nr:PIN domain-containing protein [Deinococcus sp.]